MVGFAYRLLLFSIGLFFLFCIAIPPIFLTSTFPDFSTQEPDRLGTLISAGRNLIEDGEYELAIAHFKERLSLASINNQDILDIYHVLIPLFIYVNRIDEATHYTRRALFLASSLGNWKEASNFKTELVLLERYNQALVSREAGDITISNTNFEEAYRLAGLLRSREYRQKIACIWSVNYLGSINMPRKYLDLNIEALNLAIALKYAIEASRASTKIGTFYATENIYSQALSYYLRALFYIRDKQPNNDRIRLLNNIAGIYILFGDFIKAYDYLSEAIIAIKKTQIEPFQYSAMINLGHLFLSRARSLGSPEYYKKAQECFLSFLDLQKFGSIAELSLDALAGLSSALIDQGKVDEAEALLTPALARVLKPDSPPPVKGAIKIIQAELALNRKRLPEAIQNYQEALSIATQSKIPLLIISASCGLGRCAISQQDNLRAIESFNLAIKIIGEYFSIIVNDSNRASFISKCREPYEALIKLYANLSKKNNNKTFGLETFRLSEYFRGRSLLEFQERYFPDNASPSHSLSESNVVKLNNERMRFLESLSQPALNDAQYADLKSKIMQIDDMLDSAFFNDYLQKDEQATLVQPISVDMLQSSLLDSRTAIVEYFLGEKGSFLFCLTKDSYNLVELPAVQSIYDSLVGYLSFLEDPSITPSKGIPAAVRLCEILLSPIFRLIPNSIDHLVIIPDGILFRLPFESLAIQTPTSSDTEYVNDRYTISYAPAASILFWLKNRSHAEYRKDALALGVSTYSLGTGPKESDRLYSVGSILSDMYKRSGFTIDPIPYVHNELSDLRRRFKSGNIDIFDEKKATEAVFKKLNLEDYRLIHLACHAFSDENYPLRSAILLYPDPNAEEDGFLQVSEMYAMHTRADLVVLSACNTGSGKIVQNEGILGMPRIFLYTGARSIVSTLWTVNDKACVFFMKHFYDFYLQGANKAEALRAAKQKMAKSKFAHPFYWASYVLTGEQ